MALERFIPLSPDRFIRNSQDFEVARFGHLNEIINYINSYVLPDGLQLVGSGPMTTVLRAITDNLGNASRLSLSTDTTALSADLKFLGSTSGYVSLQAPNTVTTYALKLPATTGAAGEALVTDGFGNLSFSTVSSGLQLLNDVDLTSTLTAVTDKNNNQSPLFLSTTGVQTTSTLQITTQDDPYIDAEDGLGNNRFTIGRAPASQQVNVDFASNPTGGTNFVGGIRTYQDGVNLSEVVKFRKDGQVTFSERVNLEADSLVTTQASSVIASTTTNANMVIAPNGNGALIASIPDGTATGGNARGNNAIDFSRTRVNSSQVASGTNSTISGGYANRASGSSSTISGGDFGLSSGNYSVVGGGFMNTSSNDNATIAGGSTNTASSTFSTVSGGQSNTASTGTNATVVGGQSNTSSGQHSVSGGQGNTASGLRAIALGDVNIASGAYSFAATYRCSASGQGSFAVGNQSAASGAYSFAANSSSATNGHATCFGQSGIADAEFSFVTGRYGRANLYNAFVISSAFTINDAQQSLLTARRESTLTTGATTVLSLDGTGVANLIIPNGTNRTWKVKVEWTGVITTITGTATGLTVGNAIYGEANFGFKKIGGTSSLGPVLNDVQGSDNAVLDTASLAYTAGASQELALTFTGPTFAGGGSVTMRVVAKVSLVEVAY